MDEKKKIGRLSSAAKEVVQGLIDGYDNTDGEALGPALETLKTCLPEQPLIFAEVMKRGGRRSPLAAAIIMHVVAEEYPTIATKHPEVMQESERLVAKHVTESADRDLLAFTCNMFGAVGGVPESLIPRMRKLAESEDSHLSILAVSALSWKDEHSSNITRLRRAIQSDDPVVVMIAAPALLRRNLFVEGVIERLTLVLPTRPWNEQCGLVYHLKEIGPPAISLLPMLEQLATNDEVPGYHRGRALASIGGIAKGSSADISILSRMLRSNDHRVVTGAMEGLVRCEKLESGDVSYLGEHLIGHKDVDVRRTALHAIRAAGPLAHVVLPELIERLNLEADTDIARGLSEALGNLGEAAIPPLITEARRMNARSHAWVAFALRKIGDKAVVPVAEQMLGDENFEVQYVAVDILRDIGASAASVVPLVSQTLLSTGVWETARNILRFFAELGPAAVECRPNVVILLMHTDDPDLITAGIEVLNKVGPGSVELVRAMSIDPDFPEETRARLQAVLERLDVASVPVRSDLEKLDCDKLLRYFVIVADKMKKEPTWGARRLLKEITDGPEYELLKSLGLPASDRGIQRMLEAVEEAVGRGPLTEGDSPEPKRLTPLGLQVFEEAKTYVEGKYGPTKSR